jgi:hypothetical protein
MMHETEQRCASKGYKLQVGPVLMERIIQDGYSHEYGVRPLRQVITHYVDDILSDAILHKRLQQGGLAYVEVDPMTGEPRCYDHIPAGLHLLSPFGEGLGNQEEEQSVKVMAGGGGDDEVEWVLASGGLEEWDSRNN